MYLSMFREDQGQRLREQQIISFMKIVEEFLKGLEKADTEDESFVSKSKYPLEKKWHNWLHQTTVHGNASTNLTLAWKTFEYWMKKTHNKDLETNSLLQSRYRYRSSIHIINLKIIFFSNLNTIYQILQEHKKYEGLLQF
jgi:hypothetical protein